MRFVKPDFDVEIGQLCMAPQAKARLMSVSDVIGCSDSQADLLFSMVRSLPEEALICEFGVWRGKSTLAMGFGCKGTGRRVVAVDRFLSLYEIEEVIKKNRMNFMLNDLAKDFHGLLTDLGLENVVIVIKAWFAEFIAGWRNDLDMAFIDGNHEYENVKDDIAALMPFIKVGGLMTGHDYDIDGVRQAVKGAFEEFLVRDGIWMARRIE